jgi:ribose 5-phosphate isomerase B
MRNTLSSVRRIAIGADHAGFELKQHLIAYLTAKDFSVADHGTNSTQSVDYPEICANVARAVRDKKADIGIVLGGSGQGEQIAANKINGVRAALCNDLYLAEMARSHNNANVLSIGARVVTPELAEHIVDKFLNTEFEGGRHERRVEQLREIELLENKKS